MNKDRFWSLQQRFAPYLFVSPFLILFCIFMVYPLFRSLMLSFYKTAGPNLHIFVGLDNYRFLIFHDVLFLFAVANTALFTVLFLALQVPISLGLALLLNQPAIRCRNFLRFSFFSPYLVGNVFVAVIFFEMFSSRGLVNTFLSRLSGRVVNIGWLSSPNLVMPTIIIAALWLSVGFGMIYFLAALQAVDLDLYEAAEVDGASSWGRFWHVTLPGIRPVLVYVILVGSIGGFQLFELPYVLLQGPGPGFRGMTIVMYLFSTGFSTGDLGYASAIGWILVLILLLLSIAQLKFARLTAEL